MHTDIEAILKCYNLSIEFCRTPLHGKGELLKPVSFSHPALISSSRGLFVVVSRGQSEQTLNGWDVTSLEDRQRVVLKCWVSKGGPSLFLLWINPLFSWNTRVALFIYHSNGELCSYCSYTVLSVLLRQDHKLCVPLRANHQLLHLDHMFDGCSIDIAINGLRSVKTTVINPQGGFWVNRCGSFTDKVESYSMTLVDFQ